MIGSALAVYFKEKDENREEIVKIKDKNHEYDENCLIKDRNRF